MYKIAFISICFFFIAENLAFSQLKKDRVLVAKDSLPPLNIDPLTPAKAAFYSAILPGLGQAYNKKYWKIPIIYGAIGTSIYFYIDSNNKYNVYRDEYKNRLEGNKSQAEFLNKLSDNQLIAAQKQFQQNKAYSVLFVVGFYVLNIIDANVDAALIQFNVNDRLSLKPDIYTNSITFKPNAGLTFNYNF